MALTIRNHHSRPIYVAIAFSDNTCLFPRRLHVMGWWTIATGHQAVVYENDMNEYSPMWFYQADDGVGAFWAGQHIQYLPDHAFNRCWDSSTDGKRYGFRELYVGDNEDYLLTLAHAP